MKAVVAAFNQEKALVGAFSMIVQPVVDPMDRFAALLLIHADPYQSIAQAGLLKSPASECTPARGHMLLFDLVICMLYCRGRAWARLLELQTKVLREDFTTTEEIITDVWL